MVTTTPFLDRWRRELRRGTRSPSRFDGLWRAATAEVAALEAAADGLGERAAFLRRFAAALIVAEAERAAAGAP